MSKLYTIDFFSLTNQTYYFYFDGDIPFELDKEILWSEYFEFNSDQLEFVKRLMNHIIVFKYYTLEELNHFTIKLPSIPTI